MPTCIFCGAAPDDECEDDCVTRMKPPCDGSGWLYGSDREGFGVTQACHGCDRCLNAEPVREPLVITRDTLADLLRVHAQMTGNAEEATVPLDTNEAMGLLLTYLPGLCEMAARLLDSGWRPPIATASAHPIFRSGLDPNL